MKTFLAMTLMVAVSLSPCTANAMQNASSDYLLQMARVDFLIRRQQFQQAAVELGQVPKERHEDPLFRQYADRVIAELYKRPRTGATGQPRTTPDVVRERLRVTHRRVDSDSRSDQNSDNAGWQVNQRLLADTEGKDGIRAKFQLDLEGFKDGHNDLRYRTVLADFYKGPGPAEAPNQAHLALGDSATYTSPYFMRSSRVRGIQLLLPGSSNQFQALYGAYPFWLEDRDEYIYPRHVWGLRDKVSLEEGRFKFGANVVHTRDTGKIRTIDLINQPRSNWVWSLDQELKLIPDIWYFKSAEAYSDTDDRLDEERFGDTTKLKDTSFMVESLFIQPWVRSNTRFERTGPDFRLLTDIPSGSVLRAKSLTSDRMLIEQIFDFKPMGPFDLDVEASWFRNGLDNDDTLEQTRMSWYTANLGILVPQGIPRPRFRGTITDTVSSPGSSTRPGQNRTYDLRGELSHQYEGISATAFTEYETDVPQEDKERFSPEERWSFGTRLATTFLERILVSPHYTYKITDEDFDSFTVDRQIIERREKGHHHEAGLSTSTRLWSTSSLGLSYDYLSGKLANPNASGPLVLTKAHTGTANFTWPYNHYSWNKKRKWTVFPGITFYFADLANALERRPLITSRMSFGYEVLNEWKIELLGEYHYDKDQEYNNVRTVESRIWLLWKSQWK